MIVFLITMLLYGCGGGGGGGGPQSPVTQAVSSTQQATDSQQTTSSQQTTTPQQGSNTSVVSSRQPEASPLGRSVKLNNYNNWHFTNSNGWSKEQMLNVLANMGNVCFTELWDNVTPTSVRAYNPSAKIYRIYDLCVKNNWDSDWSNSKDTSRLQTPLTKAQIDANDWWLRDGDGNIVKESGNTWFMDVGKPGFKEAFLANMLERLNGKGFDGVVFDYWMCSIGGDSSYSWLRINPTSNAYANPNDWYTKAWQPFITYVMSGLHAAGYRVVANCAGDYGTGDYKQIWQRSQIDGVIYEQWQVNWGDNGGGWLNGSVIEQRINALAHDPLEMWTSDGAVLPNDPDYDRKTTLGLAMYYIGIPTSQDKRAYGHTYDRKVFWERLWDLNIGTPVESAVKQSGRYMWTRKFTQGVVLFNYEESSQLTYTLDGSYHDMNGKTYSGTVTVEPHTALILAKG